MTPIPAEEEQKPKYLMEDNNEAKDLKGLQKAADHFLKNCYLVGIDYDNR